MIGLLKKPAFWLVLVIVIIIGLLVLVLRSNQPNNSKNLQSIPPKISEKSKPGLKPGDCLVLEQKYCSKSRLVDWRDKNSSATAKLISIDLPQDAVIFAPFDGSLVAAESSTEAIFPNSLQIEIFLPDRRDAPYFLIAGDITLNTKLNSESSDVKKGDVIAYTQNKGIKAFGGNIILTVMNYDSQKKTQITDEEFLARFLD